MELEGVHEEFEAIRAEGVYDGRTLPKLQMERMSNRFSTLTKKSDSMICKLEFEEMKFRLLAFLVEAEAKLKSWTVKYGYQTDVELMLEDYQVQQLSLFQIMLIETYANGSF